MGRTDNKTLKITQGALLCAIFGAFVLLNRQTGGVMQAFLIYIYGLPITIYTAWYGFKTSVVAAAAMMLLSFLLGTPTYAFYSCTSMLIGLAFGECLYRKVSAEKTVLWVMMISILVNLLDLLFMVFISGISLNSEAVQMQEMMQEAFTKFGAGVNEESVNQVKSIFTVDTLRRILLISKALSGVVQGFLTYLIGSLVMRKLKVKVPRPKSIRELRPPVWTGYVAMGGFLLFNMVLQNIYKNNENARSICLVAGSVFYIYLIIFGVVGLYIVLYKYLTRSKAIVVALSVVLALILPYLQMILGFIYLAKPGGIFEMPEKKTEETPRTNNPDESDSHP